jgi:hypothetical protein
MHAFIHCHDGHESIVTITTTQVGEKTASRGICGKDLNKKGTALGEVPVPESAGLAVGCIFLLCVICFEVRRGARVGGVQRAHAWTPTPMYITMHTGALHYTARTNTDAFAATRPAHSPAARAHHRCSTTMTSTA